MLLHDHVDRWAAQRPHGEFAVQGDRRATWAQARDASARAARRLRLAGLGPGDRCAVLARNAIEYVVLQVAASRAGVVLVPLNPRSTATEWDHVVRDGVARPRSVEFRSALPRTSMGKVHKRALREPFWAGQERQVAGV